MQRIVRQGADVNSIISAPNYIKVFVYQFVRRKVIQVLTQLFVN